MTTRLGLGIVGWGTAGQLMAAAASRSSQVRLAGVADVDADQRSDAARRTNAPTFAELNDLLASPDVDAVYIATPTVLHSAQIAAAVSAGRHVVVEKPMATSVGAALEDCEAADRADVVLLVGCTHSFNAPVRALRKFTRDASLGRLLAIRSSCATNWLRRRRSPADLDAGLGGGLVHRQGAHQLDIIRYVAPGTATTVFGNTYGGFDGKEGGYGAVLSFDDGAAAFVDYSGTGGFDSRLHTNGVGELAEVIAADGVLERYFKVEERPALAAPMFGTLRATFELGDALATPHGLLIFDGSTVQERPLLPDALSGWDAVLRELVDAVAGRPFVHTGHWSVGTVEMCHAVHESARIHAPVDLRHQRPTQQTHSAAAPHSETEEAS